MAGCCQPSGYDRFFDEKEATRNVRRFRRKGLDNMARSMTTFLMDRGMAGRTVLEVGGGVGAIQIELLRAGAERTTNVEMSSGYETAAGKLIAEEGLAYRVERTVVDFVDAASKLGAADDVVMNRVICCYPDMERLLGAATNKARRFLATTYPRDRWVFRVGSKVINWFFRRRGIAFQTYMHSPAAIVATAQAAGFQPVFEDRDLVWHAVVFERAS